MKLKDALPPTPVFPVEVKCYVPWIESVEMLYDICKWDGTTLESYLASYGDESYAMDDEILQYETGADGTLTIWIPACVDATE